MLEHFDPASIHDEAFRAVVLLLMNEVERLSAQVADLKEENQRLRDENRRLQGEQGKPVIGPVTARPSLSTATRVYGQNYHCPVLCNPFYTTYCALPSKDRVSMVCALLGGRPPTVLLDDEALQLMRQMKVPQKWVRQVKWPERAEQPRVA
jgi:regulator of replication initiation timing